MEQRVKDGDRDKEIKELREKDISWGESSKLIKAESRSKWNNHSGSI